MSGTAIKVLSCGLRDSGREGFDGVGLGVGTVGGDSTFCVKITLHEPVLMGIVSPLSVFYEILVNFKSVTLSILYLFYMILLYIFIYCA